MKKSCTLLMIACLFIAQQTEAKIWRVNNTIGVTADFNAIQAAVDAAAVVSGDTIHLEASSTNYGSCYLSKRLVILGPGYYFTENSPLIPNPKTEANTAYGSIYNMYFNPGSKGSVISGVFIANSPVIQDSLITIERCFIQADLYLGDNNTSYGSINDTIRQNIMAGAIRSGYGVPATTKFKNILFYNNLIFYTVDFSQNLNSIDGFFINNDFLYYYSSGPGNPVGITSTNFVYQNNIFGYVNFGAYQSSNVYFNNVCMGTGVPAGNSNVQNADVTGSVYNDWVGSGAGFSSDSRYGLKSGSNPAVNAGTLNGGPVNCGAFGGPAPYILSGMPNMPSIYSLTVPTQVNSGTATMNISLSSASH